MVAFHTMKITAPKKYLIKYESESGAKFYKIAPISIDTVKKLITAYAYADKNTSGGIRSFKNSKIIEVQALLE